MTSAAYLAFVLIPEGNDVSLELAERAVRAFFADPRRSDLGTEIERAGERLVVRWAGYPFEVTLVSGADVRAESAEIAEGAGAGRDDQGDIARCSARYEICAPEPDYDMEFFNHYLYVIHAFEAAYPKVFPFDPRSNELM